MAEKQSDFVGLRIPPALMEQVSKLAALNETTPEKFILSALAVEVDIWNGRRNEHPELVFVPWGNINKQLQDRHPEAVF